MIEITGPQGTVLHPGRDLTRDRAWQVDGDRREDPELVTVEVTVQEASLPASLAVAHELIRVATSAETVQTVRKARPVQRLKRWELREARSRLTVILDFIPGGP